MEFEELKRLKRECLLQVLPLDVITLLHPFLTFTRVEKAYSILQGHEINGKGFGTWIEYDVWGRLLSEDHFLHDNWREQIHSYYDPISKKLSLKRRSLQDNIIHISTLVDFHSDGSPKHIYGFKATFNSAVFKYKTSFLDVKFSSTGEIKKVKVITE
jgi:hypothetical protein